MQWEEQGVAFCYELSSLVELPDAVCKINCRWCLVNVVASSVSGQQLNLLHFCLEWHNVMSSTFTMYCSFLWSVFAESRVLICAVTIGMKLIPFLSISHDKTYADKCCIWLKVIPVTLRHITYTSFQPFVILCFGDICF